MDNITCGSTNSGMSFHNKMELASELNQADTDNYIVIDPKSDIIIQESPEKIPEELIEVLPKKLTTVPLWQLPIGASGTGRTAAILGNGIKKCFTNNWRKRHHMPMIRKYTKKQMLKQLKEMT